MGEGITGWRLHVGVIFPTPIPPRAIREWYEVVPDGIDITCVSLTIAQLTDADMEDALKGMERAQDLPAVRKTSRRHLHSMRRLGQYPQCRLAGEGPRHHGGNLDECLDLERHETRQGFGPNRGLRQAIGVALDRDPIKSNRITV
jgi:hypothetical protein